MKKRDRKPNLEQFMRAKIDGIRKAFTVPMRITVIARNPADPNAEVVFSDDSIDGLIATLQRRRDEVVASQAKNEG
jgi:hypothetical protein